jgi:hypothetical protein
MFSCIGSNTEKEIVKSKYVMITTEQLNDSTIEYSCWRDSLSADCFSVCHFDTIDRYIFSKANGYINYTVYDDKYTIKKIKQIVKLGNEDRLNELIFFSESGQIIDKESTYIKSEEYKDSVKLSPVPSGYFNKIRVVVSNNTNFDIAKWTVKDTIESLKPYIIVPKNLGYLKCLLQVIKMDSQGRDEAGRDFYIDLETLRCRDVTKSLICYPPLIKI